MMYDEVKLSKYKDGVRLTFSGGMWVTIDNAELLSLVNLLRAVYKHDSDRVHIFTTADTNKDYHIIVRKMMILNKTYLIFCITFKDGYIPHLFVCDIYDDRYFLLELISYLEPQTRDKFLLETTLEHFDYWKHKIKDMLNEILD